MSDILKNKIWCGQLKINKNFKKPSQRHIFAFEELDGGGVFSKEKQNFTRMQIKPKMTYITGVKNTINPS